MLAPRLVVRVWPALRLAWALPSFALVLLPLLWFSMLATPRLHIEVGVWGDHAYLSGIHAVEQSATETYRWTKPRAELTLPNLGTRYRVLEFRAHAWRPDGTPPVAALDAYGQSLGSLQMAEENRIYRVMLPNEPMRPSVRVGFAMPPYTAPGDQRAIGVAVDWVDLRALEASGPPNLVQFAGQALLVVLGVLLALRLALPQPWGVGAAVVLALAPIIANWADPLWVGAALPAWLAVLALLLVAQALFAPLLPRILASWLAPTEARFATGLIAAALLLRLLGAVHPLFDMHDLPYHTGWMAQAASGELYIYSTPSEFQNRQTFNPPAGYLLLMPLALGLEPRLAVQVGVAILDGLACLLVLLIARELGLKGRAGVLALAAALALPISMTMLWWGFATNALAQPIWLLLVWLSLRLMAVPALRRVIPVAAAAVLAMLTHVGALALIAAALCLLLLLVWRHVPARSWFALVLGLGAAAVVASVLYFSAVAPTVIAQRVSPAVASLGAADAANQTEPAARLPLLTRALLLGFTPVGVALVPFGLVLMLRAPRMQRALTLAWLGAAGGAVAAYLASGLVVRDLYFLAPLACLAMGVVLDALWRRGGRTLALIVLAVIISQGVLLWFGGVLLRIKPSGVPLTR